MSATPIRRLFAIQKSCAIEDDDFRPILQESIGRSSRKGLTHGELSLVVDNLKARGYDVSAPRAKSKIQGRVARKAWALWLSGWNLGVISNKSEQAFNDWAKGQTGKSHINWINDAESSKVVDALKKWLERTAKVNWSVHKSMSEVERDDRYKIAIAQASILVDCQASSVEVVKQTCLDLFVHCELAEVTPADWIKIHNVLGERIRRRGGSNA